MRNNHSHSEHVMEAEVMKLKQSIYNAAGELTNKSLFEIFVSMTEKIPENLAKKVTYKEMEPGMRKRRELLYPQIPKTLGEVDQFMQCATLGLNQNYHGLLKLQDGTPIGILMYHDGLFRVLEEMTQIGFDGTFFVTP